MIQKLRKRSLSQYKNEGGFPRSQPNKPLPTNTSDLSNSFPAVFLRIRNSLDKERYSATALSRLRSNIIYHIIIIFYCGLMVHITDTRSQKVVSYASARITE